MGPVCARTRAHPLHPAALAFVSYGIVLVRVRVRCVVTAVKIWPCVGGLSSARSMEGPGYPDEFNPSGLNQRVELAEAKGLATGGGTRSGGSSSGKPTKAGSSSQELEGDDPACTLRRSRGRVRFKYYLCCSALCDLCCPIFSLAGIYPATASCSFVLRRSPDFYPLYLLKWRRPSLALPLHAAAPTAARLK